MTTREFAREIEAKAHWKPCAEIYDYQESELWTGEGLGYGPYTVNVGYVPTDDKYYAFVTEGGWTYEHGPDIAADFDLGPFHSADRAKRRAIVFVASLEALADEAEAYMLRLEDEAEAYMLRQERENK